MTGEAFAPGGEMEIPDLDQGWKSYQKLMAEIVTSEQDIDDVYQELRHAMAEGEEISWSLDLCLTGAASVNSAIKVVAPTGSTGGFVHRGYNVAGSYQNTGY